MITLSFSPTSFAYNLIDDDINEPPENFNLALSVGAGVAAGIAPASGTATVTITDNDRT